MYEYINKPIVVHGDAWPNNIIIHAKQKKVVFIDWELAGPGYLGQDAGRLLWGLTLGDNWNPVGMNELSVSFIDEWCRSNKDKFILRFGVLYESLGWIADRQDKLTNSDLDPVEKQITLEEIKKFKSHTLQVLSHIPE